MAFQNPGKDKGRSGTAGNKKTFKPQNDGKKKSFTRDNKPFEKWGRPEADDEKPRREGNSGYGKRFGRPSDDKRSGKRTDSGSPARKDHGPEKSRYADRERFGEKSDRPGYGKRFEKPSDKKYRPEKSDSESLRGSRQRDEKPRFTDRDRSGWADRKKDGATEFRKSNRPRIGEKPAKPSQPKEPGEIRLNKFLANAGICSRREADTLIATGVVKVNGVVVTEMGTKVGKDDVVEFDGQKLNTEKKVYLLLNKPKGCITTVEDPQERDTVMNLVRDCCRERIYPVGRLDRNTTGLLLMTNDGDLAKKLTHPSHGIRKVYHVQLDKVLAKSDMNKLMEGIELEDGMMKVDEIAYTGKEDDKKSVGVVIHSGKNRIVRRLFEALDYKIVKLDRVAFANLTKKDLPRGKYRFLDEKELNILRML